MKIAALRKLVQVSLLLVSLSPAVCLAQEDEGQMLQEARKHFSNGGFYFSTSWLERILKNHPTATNREEILVMMVKAYASTNRDEKAAAALRILLKDYPKAAAALDPELLKLTEAPKEPAKPASAAPSLPAPTPVTAVKAETPPASIRIPTPVDPSTQAPAEQTSVKVAKSAPATSVSAPAPIAIEAEHKAAEAKINEAKAAEARAAEARVADARAAEAKAAEAKAAEAKVAEAKVAEAKVAEAKVAEAKVAEERVAEERAAEAKAAEAKAAEAKAAEAKAAEAKAAEERAAEAKAAEAKAAEARAAEAKAAEARAAEARAAEARAAEAKAAETKAAEAKAAETKAAEAKAAETKAAEAKAAEASAAEERATEAKAAEAKAAEAKAAEAKAAGVLTVPLIPSTQNEASIEPALAAPAAVALKTAGSTKRAKAAKKKASKKVETSVKDEPAVWTLQVGEYVTKAAMEYATRKLAEAGMSPVIGVGEKKKTAMFRLAAGTFPTLEAARAEQARLASNAADSFVLKESDRRYHVYAGSFFEKYRADKEEQRFAGLGVRVVIKEVLVPVPTHRLTAGTYPSQRAAEVAASQLAKQGLMAGVVRCQGSSLVSPVSN